MIKKYTNKSCRDENKQNASLHIIFKQQCYNYNAVKAMSSMYSSMDNLCSKPSENFWLYSYGILLG